MLYSRTNKKQIFLKPDQEDSFGCFLWNLLDIEHTTNIDEMYFAASILGTTVPALGRLIQGSQWVSQASVDEFDWRDFFSVWRPRWSQTYPGSAPKTYAEKFEEFYSEFPRIGGLTLTQLYRKSSFGTSGEVLLEVFRAGDALAEEKKKAKAKTEAARNKENVNIPVGPRYNKADAERRLKVSREALDAIIGGKRITKPDMERICSKLDEFLENGKDWYPLWGQEYGDTGKTYGQVFRERAERELGLSKPEEQFAECAKVVGEQHQEPMAQGVVPRTTPLPRGVSNG